MEEGSLVKEEEWIGLDGTFFALLLRKKQKTERASCWFILYLLYCIFGQYEIITSTS